MNREQEPDFDPDDSVERLIASAKGSAQWAEERSLAQNADCPAPEELRDLERGLIGDPSLRRKLARHLVACPRCFERNLELFSKLQQLVVSPLETAGVAEPVASLPVSRRPIRWRAVLAAAAALFVTIGLLRVPVTSPAPSRLVGIFPTDSHGFEMRSAPAPIEPEFVDRRVAVEVGASGFVALGRFTASGIEPMEVERTALATVVTAGEEVLLPLDRAVASAIGETWLVVFANTEPSAAELGTWMSRLASGYAEEGVEARRVVVRPR